jgi:hypothetical protein
MSGASDSQAVWPSALSFPVKPNIANFLDHCLLTIDVCDWIKLRQRHLFNPDALLGAMMIANATSLTNYKAFFECPIQRLLLVVTSEIHSASKSQRPFNLASVVRRLTLRRSPPDHIDWLAIFCVFGHDPPFLRMKREAIEGKSINQHPVFSKVERAASRWIEYASELAHLGLRARFSPESSPAGRDHGEGPFEGPAEKTTFSA